MLDRTDGYLFGAIVMLVLLRVVLWYFLEVQAQLV
jgi:Mg2+ and Co2+ transporter CorA